MKILAVLISVMMLSGFVSAMDEERPQALDYDKEALVDMPKNIQTDSLKLRQGTKDAIRNNLAEYEGEEAIAECKERLRMRYPKEAMTADLDMECKNILGNNPVSGVVEGSRDGPTINERERILNVIRERYNSLSDEEKEKLKAISRAELEKYSAEDETSLRQRLANANIIKERVEEAGKKREIAEEKIKQARERYEKAKQRYEEAKERYQERKQNFDDAKERLREACEDETSTECTEARAEAFESAKEFLLNHVDRMIASLEEVLEEAESSEGLSEERYEELTTNIEERITFLEDLRSEIEAVETKEELVDLGKELANAWKRMKITAADHRLEVIESQNRRIIQHSEALEAKLEQVLERMEAADIDTSEVDEKVTEFSEQIAMAETAYNEATELFIEFRNSDSPSENKELLDQANEKYKEAHEYLKEANDILREIYSVLKELRADEYLEEIEEVEVEDEEDDELPEVIEEDEEIISGTGDKEPEIEVKA